MAFLPVTLPTPGADPAAQALLQPGFLSPDAVKVGQPATLLFVHDVPGCDGLSGLTLCNLAEAIGVRDLIAKLYLQS